MIDPARQSRLNEIAKIAVKLEASTGVPAALTVSQWALESRYGAKPAGNFNLFGIKRAARHTQGCTTTTHEVIQGQRVKQDLQFADYCSVEESAADYAWLISNGKPYAKAWAAYQADRNSLKLLQGIAKVYASDPSYCKLLQQLAGQSDIVMAISKARM